MANKFSDIDALLKGIMHQGKPSLKELFDEKIAELDIPHTTACKLIGVQPKSIKGILTGTQKIVDITTLIKIADFLQIQEEEVVLLYMELVKQQFPDITVDPNKIEFIKKNFDLAALKKVGMIDSLSDFAQIEKKLISRFRLKSIFEYRQPGSGIAFSSGAFNPKNALTRANWINGALACFEEIDNPYSYNRNNLINLFPKIKKYSINVDFGLRDVVKLLYKIGVTVIYQPSLAGLQLRGATANVNNKPCVVLTDYKNFYPTLWFALIHELYHVIFDWEEIKLQKYHLTDDANEEVTVKERENEANIFAREYLFAEEDLKRVKKYIYDSEYIEEVADENQIHSSIIYANHAYLSNGNRSAWAKVRSHSPDFENTIKNICISFDINVELNEALKDYKLMVKF